MTDEEQAAVAAKVDAITTEAGPLLRQLTEKHGTFAASLALAQMTAHTALHDGANKSDYEALAAVAWRGAQRIHRRDCN